MTPSEHPLCYSPLLKLNCNLVYVWSVVNRSDKKVVSLLSSMTGNYKTSSISSEDFYCFFKQHFPLTYCAWFGCKQKNYVFDFFEAAGRILFRGMIYCTFLFTNKCLSSHFRRTCRLNYERKWYHNTETYFSYPLQYPRYVFEGSSQSCWFCVACVDFDFLASQHCRHISSK